jgi:hypothetical protein
MTHLLPCFKSAGRAYFRMILNIAFDLIFMAKVVGGQSFLSWFMACCSADYCRLVGILLSIFLVD